MQIELAGICFTSASGLGFSHDPWLVALSYVIAAFSSYTALDMIERLRNTDGPAAVFWHACASTALGGGIWAMHFVGMLGLTVAFPITYEPVRTVSSLFTAIGFVALGLKIVCYKRFSAGSLAVAGLIVGSGIAAMHYIGMSAMVLPGTIAYAPAFWGLSVLIAVAAATAALWLSARLRRSWERGFAALVMAVAIGGMHYTGMAAAVIQPDPLALADQGIAEGPLVTMITVGAFATLLLALVSAAGDRRLCEAAAHEAAALRVANTALQAIRLQLEATQSEIIFRLCSAGACRDNETAQHVARMAELAHRLALHSGCNDDFALRLLRVAPLHDIGKIGVPDYVLLKPGKLSAHEWTIMRTHASIGSRLLGGSGIPLLDLAAEVAGSHHEKWDGSGYPAGLRGDAIPLSGRIVAVVDVFDALLSERPYKKPWPLSAVVEYLREQAGRHFDPDLVRALLADLDAMVMIRDRFVDEESEEQPAGEAGRT